MSTSDLSPVVVYADGSCLGNPGPGGYAAIMRRGSEHRILTGGEPKTTNNRMELMAALAAIRSMKTSAPIIFKLDSQYVIHGITKWVPGWQSNGWRTAQRKPVKNVDLWQDLIAAIGSRTVTWEWVKGHAEDELNNRCDQLAREAAERAAKGV